MKLMKHSTMNIVIKVTDFSLISELENFGWYLVWLGLMNYPSQTLRKNHNGWKVSHFQNH